MTEDIYFYLDLSKEILKKKDILKAIKYYIDEKNKANIKGHYSILIFQDKGNPIFITDKKDSNVLTVAIEENWKFRPKKKSYFENGLFYIFSYIAETVRKKSKNNRVIIITDTPSDLDVEYQKALFNLVSKIKFFPTFIDIIRVSDKDTRFYSDEVKLNILASDTKGGIFYVKEKKEFFDVLKKLVKSKQQVSTYTNGNIDQIKLSKEDYAFYDRLALKLKKIPKNTTGAKCYFCKEEICPICSQIDDIPLVCASCNTYFHYCCATNFAINNNIGIPHIFRCPNCDILIKIDQDLIVETSTVNPNLKSIDEYIKTEEVGQSVGEKSRVGELTSKDIIEGEGWKSKEIEHIEKPKTVRFGGFFGKVYQVKKSGDKVVYEKLSPNPLSKKEAIQEIKFRICPVCGMHITSSEQKNCSKCGAKLE